MVKGFTKRLSAILLSTKLNCLIILFLFFSTSLLFAQNRSSTNLDFINEVKAVNYAIKNGTATVNSLDTIPSCSAQWTYNGGTGVVPDNDTNGLIMNFPVNDVVGTNMGTNVNLVGVYLYIQNYRIGDIKVELISPGGTSVLLVDRMGYPATLPYGCMGDNINATFVRGTGAEAENVCNMTPPALGGVHSAETGDNLNNINIAGGSPNGTWHLKVTDYVAGDPTFVLGWRLYFDQQPPNAAYTYNNIGLFVDLQAQTTLSGNATYYWSFGDGDTAIGQHVNHEYPARGSYTILLTVVDSCGMDTISNTYALETVPCWIEFPSTTTPTPITDNNPAGDTLEIYPNTVIGYQLGKDVQLAKVCIQGTHTRTGDLKMKLISPGGVVVTLMDRPYFPWQPTGCTQPDFDFCIIHGDSADNEDACDLTGAAVKGEFTAFTPQDLRSVNDLVTNPNGPWKLVVYDMAAGHTGTVTGWSLWFDKQDPDPFYTYTFSGLTVNCSSKNLPAVNYRWDFGDGTPIDTNQSPSHTYATPGYKTITVYTDNACSADTLIRTIRLYACEEEFTYNAVPVAVPDNDSAGVIIPFNVSGVDGNTLGVDAYITRVCITSDHVLPGDMQVKLKAPNGKFTTLINRPGHELTDDGCQAPGVDICIVEGSQNTTRFVCDYQNAPPGIEGFYTGLGNPLEYINQNGGAANGLWRLYCYDLAVFHTGSITSFKLYFGKFLPKANFSYTTGAPGVVNFASPNVNTVSYSWDFGDGTTSTLANPSHTYLSNGEYTVKLVANDSCVADSSIQTVFVTTYNSGCISSFEYDGSPVPINDNDSINGSVLTFNPKSVSGTTLGSDVNLTKIFVKGQHTRVGDLKMKLVAPNGEETVLFDRPGYPATAFGCVNNDFTFTISNGQGTSLENICNSTPPALYGNRTTPPGYDLGSVNFGGGSPDDNWQLVVYDYALGETGSIESIKLFFDNQKPNPDFSYTSNLNTVSFNAATNNGVTYSWSFGDGNTSTIGNPVNVYADTGTYAVTLIVTDSCGSDSLTQLITVYDILSYCVSGYGNITPTAIPDSSSAGVIINLNLSGISGTDLGNDVSLTKACISGTHTNVGDLKMTLVAPNGVMIDLMDRPGYPATSTGCSGDDFDVCFTKGILYPLENVCDSVAPSLSGNYNAANGGNLSDINSGGGSPNGNWQLIVSDLETGNTGQVNSVQLYFNNQPHTDASFTYTVSLNNIYFNGVNQADATYTWSFGDGDSASFEDPSHAYTASGTYTVTLTVTDSCGSNTTTQQIPVIIYAEPTCVKEFEYLNLPVTIPNNDSTGVNINFNISGIAGANLGSNVNLVKVKLTGTHNRMGDVSAKLIAPNGQVIQLMDRPGYPATTLGCTEADFDFEVIRGINYDVEDVCSLTPPAIAGTFTATNNQNLDSVNLAGGNPNGLWRLNISDNAPIIVGGQLTGLKLYFDNQPGVDPDFTYSISGNAVDFFSANVPGVSYFWSFGTGITSTDANPVYSFPLTGTYTVTLVATDSCGSDSSSQTINVVTYAEPTCTASYSFGGTPVAIPDNDSTGVALTLNLTDVYGNNLGTDVSLVRVCLTGFISNVGDVKATLIAPNGVSVELIDRPGYPALPSGCPNADFDFCIVRGVGNSTENSCSSLPPAVGGEHTAMEGFNLDSLNIAGGSPNGTWTLILHDYNAGSTGQLAAASLVFDNQPQVDASFSQIINGYDAGFTSQNQSGVNYSWSFGDGNTSTDANPVHTYLSNGSYTVTLIASDSCGSVTEVQNVIINQPVTCTKNFDYTNVPVVIPDNDSTGVTVTFNLTDVIGNNLGTDVRLTSVCVAGTHSNMGDLIIKMGAPNGKDITLIDRPGYPSTATGCSGDDFDFCVIGGFDFNNEDSCGAVSPSITGNYSAVNDNLDSINYYGGNPNGNWTLTLIDDNATETGTLTSWKLQFNAQPPVADFTYVVNGYTVDFTGPSVPNAQYSWNFGDTVTSNLQNPQHIYSQSGSYQVVLTVTDSCGTTISTQVIPITVGIYEVSGSVQMSVLPNPANEFIDISIKNNKSVSMKMEILNEIGEQVYISNLYSANPSYNKRINCSTWSKGVYLLKLSYDDQVKQLRFVVQ